MALGANKTDFSIDVSKLDKYIQDSRNKYEAELKRIVDIPSVSMDPAHANDITRTAHYAVELLKEIGAKAEAIPTDGNPVVYGELHAGDDYPTVIIYNHLDVQPADASEWKAPPFNMTIENGVYRGRGSTDDKGPALAVMYAAKFAHDNKLPLNIKFLWELEEEIGSPSFEKFLEKHAKKLACDSVVISDTIWVSRDKPAIPYGLRGLQGMMVKLKTGQKDVHSGLTGGLARNPIGELAKLISECYDASTGEVKITGFYDSVNEPSETEKQNFVNSGFTVENFKKAHELIHVRTHDACEGSARIWARPTFEVHGIVGGYTGPGVKTIVPHHAEAKISMRLVPNQDPDEIFALVSKFIKEKAPDAEIIKEGALRPFLGVNTGPLAEAAKASMMFAFGKQPAFTREGGSIGAVLSMNQILGAPIMFLGLSLPEHGQPVGRRHKQPSMCTL